VVAGVRLHAAIPNSCKLAETRTKTMPKLNHAAAANRPPAATLLLHFVSQLHDKGTSAMDELLTCALPSLLQLPA
jgi:hypothetical protein